MTVTLRDAVDIAEDQLDAPIPCECEHVGDEPARTITNAERPLSG